MAKSKDTAAAPTLSPEPLCVLGGAFLAAVAVALMALGMRGSPPPSSLLIRLYKLWHAPALLVGNCLWPRFLVLAACEAIAFVAVLAAGAGGYVAGALVGAPGAMLGAASALVAVLMLCRALIVRLTNRPYLERLSEDLFSKSAGLRTVNRRYVFPLHCALQSMAVLGTGGALVGAWLAEGTISPVPLAIVSAFLGLFCALVLASARSGARNRAFRTTLSVLQVAVAGLLTLPGVLLLADHDVPADLRRAVTSLAGEQDGVDLVFAAAFGVALAGCAGAIAGRGTNLVGEASIAPAPEGISNEGERPSETDGDGAGHPTGFKTRDENGGLFR